MALPVDPKAYYGYLFKSNKQPTEVLDQLLRGIALYIIENIGDVHDKSLSPGKLASFYKAVGGNYDSLFVHVPHPSISWIYASIGCQHTLQPTANLFDPPSIPTLTVDGFVRWESIEILLGPEEHVPFIQNALRDFAIINPDTGEPFPVDLPTEAFPLTTDQDIELWHSQCAQKLRQQATPDPSDDIGSRPDLPPRPAVHAGYSHVRAPAGSRPKSDYFDPRQKPTASRPIPFQHVTSAGRPVRPGLARDGHRRAFLAPEAGSPESPRLARSRRRSFPENLNSSPNASPNEPSPDLRPPPDKDHLRRHSHPRHARRGSISSDASSERDEPSSPDIPRRRSQPYPRDDINPSIRFEYPSPITSPQPNVAAFPESRPRTRVRRDMPDEPIRERPAYPAAMPVDLNGKLSEPFIPRLRNNSRGNVRWKDLSDISYQMRKNGNRSSEEERESARRDGLGSNRQSRDMDRELEKERDRDSGSGGGHKRREWEREREPLSPRVRGGRHSSHEDERKDRDSPRERDWEMGRGEGKSFRERERDRRGGSPVRGVGKEARYYPVMR